MAMNLRPSSPVGDDVAALAERVRADLRVGVDATPRRVTGVTLRSQDVQAGDLFAALPGARSHGAKFAADAVRQGAVAVLTDEAGAQVMGSDTATVVLVHPSPRTVLGDVAAAVYGRPSEH